MQHEATNQHETWARRQRTLGKEKERTRVTANQLKRSKSLNKYSGLFTEHQELSDGWVVNVYLSDPSYGDFRLIVRGPPLFALPRAIGHKCQARR
ncbi:hypothetical protein Q8A67_024656 [Cirrhinus molitorella]|uniref:Uncharacterized protein n=1 Tax=Cirrhinus molitorella TaxID=172907 RepID=A0AA88P509_9TELE|nr:hypothetical protein Q8A67_024656 [Cirrhinus molitorella]